MTEKEINELLDAIDERIGRIYQDSKSGAVYRCDSKISYTGNVKLTQLKSIGIENGTLSDEDFAILNGGDKYDFAVCQLGHELKYTIEICGDIYQNLSMSASDSDPYKVIIGNVVDYGVCIEFTCNSEYTSANYNCITNPKKYSKDLNPNYYLKFYVDIPDLKVSNNYSPKLNAKSICEKSKGMEILIRDSIDSHIINSHGTFKCTLLKSAILYGYKYIDSYAFYGGTELEKIYGMENVVSILNNAFTDCHLLRIDRLPKSLEFIGDYAFSGCRNIKNIIFEGIPKYISNNVFSSCTKLTDIKVPWSEGAVAGAPWGATNATITYNYTGE